MFSKQPKIKQITSCTAGDFLFVFGVDRRGVVYIWNSIECVWKLHKNQAPPQEVPNGGK